MRAIISMTQLSSKISILVMFYLKNILICDVSYKTLTDAKSLCIMFDKTDVFIRDYSGNKYFVVFGLEKYDVIYDRIIYLIGLKSSITYVFCHNDAKIKIIQMMISL